MIAGIPSRKRLILTKIEGYVHIDLTIFSKHLILIPQS